MWKWEQWIIKPTCANLYRHPVAETGMECVANVDFLWSFTSL